MIWAILKFEDTMVLNNVTDFHRIIIKSIHLREQTSFQPTIFHKLRAITPLSMVPYRPLSNLEDILVLNNVTKFHKILIKTIHLKERTSYKTVNFNKQRAITAEIMVRYGPLSNLKKTLW